MDIPKISLSIVLTMLFLLAASTVVAQQTDGAEQLILPIVMAGNSDQSTSSLYFDSCLVVANLSTTTINSAVELYTASGERIDFEPSLELPAKKNQPWVNEPWIACLGSQGTTDSDSDSVLFEGWARIEVPSTAFVHAETEIVHGNEAGEVLSDAHVPGVVPATEFWTTYTSVQGRRSAYSFVNPSPTEEAVVVAILHVHDESTTVCIVTPPAKLRIPPQQRLSLFGDEIDKLLGGCKPEDPSAPQVLVFRSSVPIAIAALATYRTGADFHFGGIPVRSVTDPVPWCTHCDPNP